MGVILRLDALHVRGTRREANRSDGKAAAGLTGGDGDHRHVPHRGGDRVHEGVGDVSRFREGPRHDLASGLVGVVLRLVAGAVALDAINRLVDPLVHGLGRLPLEAVAVAVGLEALDGLIEALDRLLVLVVPRIEVLVLLGSLHEFLQALVVRR